MLALTVIECYLVISTATYRLRQDGAALPSNRRRRRRGCPAVSSAAEVMSISNSNFG